jgi:hypothetical protein
MQQILKHKKLDTKILLWFVMYEQMVLNGWFSYYQLTLLI